jgi:hypothetical protein
MRRPRIRFTVRRLMAAVALAALASMAVAEVCRGVSDPGMRLDVLEACLISAAYGVGSMRRPLMFLVPLLVFLPATMLPLSVISLTATGCDVAWIIGAPIGWFLRVHRRWTRSSYWRPTVEADGERLRCSGDASDSRCDG